MSSPSLGNFTASLGASFWKICSSPSTREGVDAGVTWGGSLACVVLLQELRLEDHNSSFVGIGGGSIGQGLGVWWGSKEGAIWAGWASGDGGAARPGANDGGGCLGRNKPMGCCGRQHQGQVG